MPNFPTENKERTTWSVWRENEWLGEWHRKPFVGQKIKPAECLFSKTILRIDHGKGRIYVK